MKLAHRNRTAIKMNPNINTLLLVGGIEESITREVGNVKGVDLGEGL